MQSALKVALRKLRASDRLRIEIESHLGQSSFSKEIICETIAYLETRRILNDARTISQIVERCTERGEGRNKLRGRLIAKGLDESAAELMASSRTDQEEIDLAIMETRSARKAGADRQRAARKLISKGFEFDVAEQAVSAVFGTAAESDAWTD